MPLSPIVVSDKSKNIFSIHGRMQPLFFNTFKKNSFSFFQDGDTIPNGLPSSTTHSSQGSLVENNSHESNQPTPAATSTTTGDSKVNDSQQKWRFNRSWYNFLEPVGHAF